MSTLLKTRKMYLYLCVWSVSVHVRCVQVSVVVKRGHQVLWGWSYRWFVLPIVGAGNQALVLCKSRSYSYPPSHLRSSQLLQMALTELFQRPKLGTKELTVSVFNCRNCRSSRRAQLEHWTIHLYGRTPTPLPPSVYPWSTTLRSLCKSAPWMIKTSP